MAGWRNCPLSAPEYALYSLQEVAPTMDDKIKHEIMPAATNYYQKRRLVKRLSGQPVTGIVYYAPAGRALTSGEAALLPKKEIRRLCEEFADGSKVWLNFSDQPWEVAGNTIATLGFRGLRGQGGKRRPGTTCASRSRKRYRS